MKIWTWGIKYADDNVWEHIKEPIEMNFEEDFLKQVRYGEKPVIEIALTHARTILYLFNNEESANIFQEGFVHGRRIETNGSAVWQDKLDKYIDASIEDDTIYNDGDMRGYEI